MRIEAGEARIEIDTLVFEAMTPEDARTAANAFAEALARLLTEYGLPEGASLRTLADVAIEELAAASSEGPAQTGRRLAEALYERLGP